MRAVRFMIGFSASLLAILGSLTVAQALVTFTVTYSTPQVGDVGSLVSDSSPYGLVSDGDRPYAYLVNLDAQSISTLDMSNPAEPTPVALTPPQGTTGGLPDQGFPTEIFKQGNYLFTILNNTAQIAVIDVLDPHHPEVVALTPVAGNLGGLPSSGRPINGALVGSYLYVVNRDDNSLSTVNIANPLAPSVVSTVSFAPDFSSGANGISARAGYVYVASRDDDRVAVFSIANPATPVKVGVTPTPGDTGGFDSGSGPKELAISGNYLFSVNADNSTVSVVDVASPQHPFVVASTPPPGEEGGLASIGSLYAIALDGNRALLTDDSGRVSLLSIRVATAPVFYAVTPEVGTPGGLPIYTNPSVPQRVFTFDGYGFTSNYGSNSLSVFQLSSLPAAPSNSESESATDVLAATGNASSVWLPVSMLVIGLLLLISRSTFREHRF